jgi:hypothetical protein
MIKNVSGTGGRDGSLMNLHPFHFAIIISQGYGLGIEFSLLTYLGIMTTVLSKLLDKKGHVQVGTADRTGRSMLSE